ncbi:MAG: asparagine synthase (glutamine-hydrolyzing) [Candidatus Thiothrix moscowensis]|nr:asparagine synthase (glutamine-hydrolyzing) [Candidatus Thiothrix moscowensis]
MCGIIGYFTTNAATTPWHRLQAGTSALQHRGPNDQGVEIISIAGGKLALGHTRLAIIDLSPAGHQPMQSSDGRYSIIFNGEIYNYHELREDLRLQGYAFCSDSDTEVLLACWSCWGEACLPKLRGMFAFILLDRQEQTLICVRDAFGIKPFFYHHDTTGFSFSSEIPALLHLLPYKPSLNLQRAYDYLIFGSYDDQEASFFKGINHLKPGHTLTLSLVDNNIVKYQRWWWPNITENTDLSFTQASEQLREIFLYNIRLHLRSDVPLGAALSGGVDSSAVVCAMRHLEPNDPIHTFSYVARDSVLNEEPWIDLVNTHIDAIPHKILVSPDELANDLDDMILAQGEPFGGTSIYAQYRVFRLARDHGITVTLDGQGADELLAGYQGYPGERMASLLDKGAIWELITFLQAWSKWPGRSLPHGIMSLLRELIPIEWQHLPRKLIDQDPLPSWINHTLLNDAGVLPWRSFHMQNTVPSRRLMSTLRHNLSGGNLTSLLRHGDRNSMRWSIESRVPFLTTDMAEFLLSLPESYLISQSGETKHIFRAAMRGLVPDAILDRRDKIGFATPEQSWLKILGKQVLEWTDNAENIPLLNAKESRTEIQAIIDGKKHFNLRAWRLINLCRWSSNKIFSSE